MNKRLLAGTRLFFVLAVLVFAAACAPMKGYVGPDRPTDETSTIAAFQGTVFYKCDGLAVSSNREIVVLPGVHTIEVGFQERTETVIFWNLTNLSLTFKTESGHRYDVFAGTSDSNYWTACVRDRNTGKRVDSTSFYSEEALKRLEDQTRSKPSDASAWYNKGVALYSMQRYQEALSAYEKAIELKHNYVEAWNNKGIVLLNLRRYEKAVDTFDRAIELNISHTAAHYNRGLTYYALGNLRQAIKDYDRAIELYPTHAAAYYSRGLVYRKLGNDLRAMEDFQGAARLGLKQAQDFLTSKGVRW